MEAGGQLRHGKAGPGPPLPVAPQGGGGVHPRLVAQAQHVLHLHHGAVRRAGPDGPHHAPVLPLRRIQVEVLPGQGHVRRLRLGQPAQGGVVVVGAHIGHAVGGVVVGLIGPAAAVPAVEGELEHLHAGEAGVGEELVDGGGEEAQILGDDGPLSDGRLQGPEEVQPRPRLPEALFGVLRPGGDGVVGLKPPEMVDAQHVVEAELKGDAAEPPAVAVGLHGLPVEQGVAPPLAVGGEAVGRTARHAGGAEGLVHLELGRVGPHVGAVLGHVDGKIPDDGDPLLRRPGLQGLPLAEEQELDALPEPQLPVQLPGRGGQGRRLPPAEGGGPLAPGRAVMAALEGHEQGVVVQPVRLPGAEGGQLLQPPGPQAAHRLAQHGEALPVQQAVVHPLRVLPPVQALILLRLQQALGAQIVQINEVGAAGEGGEGLIGGVAVAGGPNGQHLPVRLARPGQKIHKGAGLRPQGAHPPGGGQGGERHQNAGTSHHHNTLFLGFDVQGAGPSTRTLSRWRRVKGTASWMGGWA